MILHLSPRGETSQLSLEVIKFKSVCAKLMQLRFSGCLSLWRKRYGHKPL